MNKKDKTLSRKITCGVCNKTHNVIFDVNEGKRLTPVKWGYESLGYRYFEYKIKAKCKCGSILYTSIVYSIKLEHHSTATVCPKNIKARETNQ